jgi:hypothetical protein
MTGGSTGGGRPCHRYAREAACKFFESGQTSKWSIFLKSFHKNFLDDKIALSAKFKLAHPQI